MPGSAWPKYPPCVSAACTNPACCAKGHRFRWPELVGKTGAEAKVSIEKENPLATVVTITPGRVGTSDFCCNRVYVVLDNNGKVFYVPQVG